MENGNTQKYTELSIGTNKAQLVYKDGERSGDLIKIQLRQYGGGGNSGNGTGNNQIESVDEIAELKQRVGQLEACIGKFMKSERQLISKTKVDCTKLKRDVHEFEQCEDDLDLALNSKPDHDLKFYLRKFGERLKTIETNVADYMETQAAENHKLLKHCKRLIYEVSRRDLEIEDAATGAVMPPSTDLKHLKKILTKPKMLHNMPKIKTKQSFLVMPRKFNLKCKVAKSYEDLKDAAACSEYSKRRPAKQQRKIQSESSSLQMIHKNITFTSDLETDEYERRGDIDALDSFLMGRANDNHNYPDDDDDDESLKDEYNENQRAAYLRRIIRS